MDQIRTLGLLLKHQQRLRLFGLLGRTTLTGEALLVGRPHSRRVMRMLRSVRMLLIVPRGGLAPRTTSRDFLLVQRNTSMNLPEHSWLTMASGVTHSTEQIRSLRLLQKHQHSLRLCGPLGRKESSRQGAIGMKGGNRLRAVAFECESHGNRHDLGRHSSY